MNLELLSSLQLLRPVFVHADDIYHILLPVVLRLSILELLAFTCYPMLHALCINLPASKCDHGIKNSCAVMGYAGVSPWRGSHDEFEMKYDEPKIILRYHTLV